MSAKSALEREVLVVTCWAVGGLLALGFLLEGGNRDSFFLGAIGMGLIIVSFAVNIVVNYAFGQGFTKGEAALAMGIFAVASLIFVVAVATGALTEAGFYIGLATLGLVAVGFLAYLITRFGAAGAFKRFDATSRSHAEHHK